MTGQLLRGYENHNGWGFYLVILVQFCNEVQYIVLQVDQQSHCGYATNKIVYYSFKIFLLILLAQTPRLILHNQLALTKFGKRLQYPTK